MEEIETEAEYARRRGVERSAINQWLKRGILKKACVNERGRIVAVAERELKGRLNTVRSRTQIAAAARTRSRKAGSAAHPKQPVSAEIQVAKPATVSDNVSSAPPAPPDDPLFQLRLEKERLEIRRREVALDITLGRYVLAAVRANRRRVLAEIVQMTEAWLPTLISELGLGKKELDVARASYHAVRERQVAAMGEG